MKRLNLAGEWTLTKDGKDPIQGGLPGCNYLDYIANGMDDPFFGENETKASEVAHHDYEYSREFLLPDEMLDTKHLELVADGLDTLCRVTINGQEVGKTNNINRLWRIGIKDACKAGSNTIEIAIANPYKAIEAKQSADPLKLSMMPVKGIGHLRKTPCHFSWDWGPKLPPAGLTRSIEIESYDARIEDVRICQGHGRGDGAVRLFVSAEMNTEAGISGELQLTCPKGDKSSFKADIEGKCMKWEIPIEKPELWWCNGLGGQPLYRIDVTASQNGSEADSFSKQIGLRTIELDTSPDEHGHQFRFVVNKIPIFAKGANWIPADSFITRADKRTIDFYVEAARNANMNMLRVWGGGMYESEDFYDACDRNGILVWQDFAFACNTYPFYNEEFFQNVRAEAVDNVRRLRHRASLALWCANNENDLFLKLLKKGSQARESNTKFYYETLRDWVAELDGTTSYWPGSPSSGSSDYRPHNMKPGKVRGDTHLWNIWHGMRPIEGFRDYPTRFCSEYGMESMPAMHTIRSFTDVPEPGLFDPVMRLHQKCTSGNEKMLYYLLAKYRNPAKFEDFVYLSQIVQANTVRFATDCWRRNMGKQNGSIFWQLNDCWPVASWAGIDYEKQLKAVMYHSKHFNKPICLSNDYFNDRAELYIINEYPNDFAGRVEWAFRDFYGKTISSGTQDVAVEACSSKLIITLRFTEHLKGGSVESDNRKGQNKKEAALEVRLFESKELAGGKTDVASGGEKEIAADRKRAYAADAEMKVATGGETGLPIDEKAWLLVPDKNTALPKATVQHSCTLAGTVATVSLYSDTYARYVYLEAEGVIAPWSDNFFDIPAGGSIDVTVALPKKMSADELNAKLKIKTLTDVLPKNSLLKDKFLRIAMMMRRKNWLMWIIFKMFLG